MARQRRDVPWLTWRDNGVAYANWYDENKRRSYRQSLDTRDPVEAAKRFGKFLIDGPARPVGDAGLTVSQALDDYQRQHVEAKDDRGRPLVADTERQITIIGHLKAYFGDASLVSVGPLESRSYVDARRKGLIGGGKRRKTKVGSDNTIRRELNCLVAAFNHAVKWGKLPDDTKCRIELPAESRGEGVKWLTKDQLRAALKKADSPLRDFIMLAYYTGARRKSIERLTKFQVDLTGGHINLMPPESRATKKRKPIVPIYPEIRPVVERLMSESETEWLFGTPRSFYRDFVKLMASLDPPIEAHPHLLRHSRATHLLFDGQTIYFVAKLLGDTVATIERVYGHYSTDFLQTDHGLHEHDGKRKSAEERMGEMLA